MRTLAIGVTGSAGSGKSTLCGFWTARGAERVDADALGRELLLPESPVFPALVDAFGSEILGPDGRIDRGVLGARVFADDGERSRLNALVHPPLLAELHRRLAEFRVHPGPTRVLLVDAALLVEWGDRGLWDRLVLVTAGRARQVARLVASRGFTPAQAEARLATQLGEEERRGWSDYEVSNDGDLADLETQADRLWESWQDLLG